MSQVRTVLLINFLFFFGPVHPYLNSQTIQELFESADRLAILGHDGAALVKIRQVITREPSNFKAYVIACEMLTRIGQRQTVFETAKTNFSEAEKYGKKAIDLKPESPEGYFAAGHAIERLAEASGDKNGLVFTGDILRFAKHAIKNDNKHAGAWYLLGIWHLRLATLRAGSRATASILHGGIPEEVSLDKAIRALIYANQFDAGKIIYHYDLARAYKEAGLTDESKSELSKALVFVSDHPFDVFIKQKCKSFLAENF